MPELQHLQRTRELHELDEVVGDGLLRPDHVAHLQPAVAEQIIAREKPDALLPTLGGQTALNLAVALAKSGALERHGVRLIGASLEAIEKAEDRQLFKDAMNRVGVDMPRSGEARVLSLRPRDTQDVVIESDALLSAGDGYGFWLRTSNLDTGKPYEAGISMLEESAEVRAWNDEAKAAAKIGRAHV